MLKKKSATKPKKVKPVDFVVELGLVLIVFIILATFLFLINKFAWGNFSILFLTTSPLWITAGVLIFYKLTSKWISIFLALIILLPISFILIPVFYKNPKCFVNLSEVKAEGEFAEQLKIDLDNADLLKPIYDKYYKTIAPSSFKMRINKILAFLRLKKKRNWSELDFPLLLTAARKLQEEYKFPASDIVIKIKLAPTSKIIVFGDLQGAFPSLTRDLLELKKLDLIDDSLKLKNKDDLIVLTGDAVSRSPFQLEHLSLIFKLYLQNPEQFFYIKGHHETDGYWQEFNLKSEINIRLANLFPLPEGGKSIFQDELDNFFKRLPNGIYCELPSIKEGEALSFIRISHYGSEKTTLFAKSIEKKLANFLSKKIEVKTFDFLNLNDLKEDKADKDILLKAIIKSEKKRENYQDMDGLRLLSPEDGIPAWTMMSCPTEVYQKGLKFFYDSFSIIILSPKLENTQIEVHKQDVKTKPGFLVRQVNLFSSKELGEKIIASEEKLANQIN